MARPDPHLRIADRPDIEVEASIAREGFHATHVLGDRFTTPCSYTTGLGRAGHPELVILGLGAGACVGYFGHVVDGLRRGEAFPIGHDTDLERDGTPFRLLPIPPEHWTGGDSLLPRPVGASRATGTRTGRSRRGPYLQLIWPDADHRFPWTEHPLPHHEMFRDQRVLDDGDPPTRWWPLDDVDAGPLLTLCRSSPSEGSEADAPPASRPATGRWR